MMKSALYYSTFRLKEFLLLVLTIAFSTVLSAAEPMSLSRYELGSGDKINISVYGEEDMDKQLILSDAGTVSYPFLGEFRAKGMTVGQLEQMITKRLKEGFFIDPRVSVGIVEYRKFYVSGEVKAPGGFQFEPGLTLEKAVALAGGFTQRASKRGILVTREENGRPKERELSLNESVLPGDIIVVNESFF